jgi:hypothetical protein
MKLWYILIIVSMLVGLDCKSKNSAPIQLASPINLQIGISLDSAKRLTKDAGWNCDSIRSFRRNAEVAWFSNIRFSNADYPFSGMLTFREDSLSAFRLYENAPEDVVRESVEKKEPLFTLRHYWQTVAMMKCAYGTPSDSVCRVRTLPPNVVPALPLFPNQRSDKDTDYSTRWGDTSKIPNKIYYVLFNTFDGGSVSFYGLYYNPQSKRGTVSATPKQ